MQHMTKPEAKAASVMLLHGEENTFTHLVEDLYDLAVFARQSAGLTALIKSHPADPWTALARLEAENQGPEKEVISVFRFQFESFLQVYGNRTGKGFGSDSTILTPSWREKPGLVLSLGAPYLDPAVESPEEARKRAQRSREEAVVAILSDCEDPELAAEFRIKLAQAQREGTILEDHNHFIDQMSTGQLRAAFLEAGRRLLKQGQVADLEDIFWLRVAEITAMLRSQSTDSLSALVAERKMQHQRWEEMYAPPILGIPTAALGSRPPLVPEVTNHSMPGAPLRLSGLGASPGRRRGRARLVHNKTLLPDLQPGDILVAENAGPLWTPIFPILGGLVLDLGTVGQHAAATAREYGIPAVIGVQYATTQIQEGAWVVVDGETGTVEVVEQH
jgi:rifampicin phosphotransferase